MPDCRKGCQYGYISPRVGCDGVAEICFDCVVDEIAAMKAENGLLKKAISSAAVESMVDGHWTTTPPTEPGWYKARENKGEPEFLRVHEDAEDGALYILRGCDRYALTYRENWWSEKETFPPLPESE